RRGRVHRREGRLTMTVEARRRVGRDHVGQRAAPLWRLAGSGRPRESERCSQNERAAYRHLHPYGPLARGFYLSSHNRARSGLTMPQPGASTTTSKSPLRIASNHGPVGTTFCVILRPTLPHWSISQAATYL